jgi:excisionase family DNA binding protein
MIEHKGKQYYSTTEAGQVLHLTNQSILRYIKTGRLPGTKIGVRYFIAAEGIERLLDAALKPKAAKEKK